METTYRITDPIEHRPGKFRSRIILNGQRSWGPLADTAEQAKRHARRYAEHSIKRTPLSVSDVIARYRQYQEIEGNKPRSIETTGYRLRKFFAEPALAVDQLTPKRCTGYYLALVGEQKGATHQNTLAEARTLCRWMIERKMLRANPVEGIKPIGRKTKGKPQLRVDEARLWLKHAERLAEEGHDGAIAAMMTLTMGLRCSEVVGCVVRDLDEAGRVLWIEESKTAAGRRRVRVPDFLQPYLMALTHGRRSTAYIFTTDKSRGGAPYRAWPRSWVKRICKVSGVMRVSAHSMRGLFATLGLEVGMTPHAVAATLGHEKPRTTLEHYAQRGAADVAPRARALATLLADHS